MNRLEENKKQLDKLLWFIPIRSLRYLLREIIYNIFNINELVEQNNKLNNEILDLQREIRYINTKINKNTVYIKISNDWSKDFNNHIYYMIIKTLLNKRNLEVLYSEYNPDIEIFSVVGDKELIYRSNAKIKFFHTGEPVINGWLKGYEDNCIGISNLSIGFNHLNNLTYVRIPLWFLYVFESVVFYEPNKDMIYKRLNEINNIRYNKTKFAALINKWDPSNIRMPIYNSVSKIDHISCPGKFLHNDDSLKNEYNDNKLEYLKQFKFNICPENCVEDGYITEKMLHSFMAGCIPIWNGDKNIEGEIINKNAVLYWDNNADNTEIIKEIETLHKNDDLYDKFIKQKRFNTDAATDYIYNQIILLHTKIEDLIKTNLL